MPAGRSMWNQKLAIIPKFQFSFTHTLIVCHQDKLLSYDLAIL